MNIQNPYPKNYLTVIEQTRYDKIIKASEEAYKSHATDRDDFTPSIICEKVIEEDVFAQAVLDAIILSGFLPMPK